MAGWHCDGIPKDGKKYTHSKFHEPHLNYGLDCEICGLPQEAMIAKTTIINFDYDSYKLVLGIAITLFILGIGVYFSSLIIQKSCSKGMQKVEGQCIDPYLETYELGSKDAEKALAILKNYRTVEELKQAQTHLKLSINKLSQIPESALVYPEAKAKINSYDNLSKQIAKVINNFQLCAIEPKPDACLF